MDSYKSVKTCNSLEPNSNQDLLSDLPDIAIDKILKLLPLKLVAKMSILSRKWRRIWLSLKYLVFDNDFWDEMAYKSRGYDFVISNANCIISNILLHHVGPVYEFHLCIPIAKLWRIDGFNYSGWVSLLSKVGVKKIAILCKLQYGNLLLSMPSYVFDCKDLVKLKIETFILNHPPSHFQGFAHLQRLDLVNVQFKHDAFRSLIANCPRLIVFKLMCWTGMDDLVIDMPCVEHLTIEGRFDTIVFKNVQCLSFLSLSLTGSYTVKRLDQVILTLASSCQLQELHFGGWICESFGAGRITRSLTLQFLHRLCLTEVDLSDPDTFCFTLGLVQCCPHVTDLSISVKSLLQEFDDKFDYTKNCELKHLIKVKITGLKGIFPELQLIEFLLSSASKLEKLAFNYCNIRPISELKMIRDLCHLLEFPRASPKAKLICLENKSM